MGFKASSSISKMQYDFRPYVDDSGDIPEPSADKIRDFFDAQEQAARAWRDGIAELEPEGPPETWSRAQQRQYSDDVSEYARKHHAERLQRRIEILAEVCSNKPSVSTLTELATEANRVLDAFESYVWDELGPKGSTSAGKQ